jgi:hypothetical protein
MIRTTVTNIRHSVAETKNAISYHQQHEQNSDELEAHLALIQHMLDALNSEKSSFTKFVDIMDGNYKPAKNVEAMMENAKCIDFQTTDFVSRLFHPFMNVDTLLMDNERIDADANLVPLLPQDGQLEFHIQTRTCCVRIRGFKKTTSFRWDFDYNRSYRMDTFECFPLYPRACKSFFDLRYRFIACIIVAWKTQHPLSSFDIKVPADTLQEAGEGWSNFQLHATTIAALLKEVVTPKMFGGGVVDMQIGHESGKAVKFTDAAVENAEGVLVQQGEVGGESCEFVVKHRLSQRRPATYTLTTKNDAVNFGYYNLAPHNWHEVSVGWGPSDKWTVRCGMVQVTMRLPIVWRHFNHWTPQYFAEELFRLQARLMLESPTLDLTWSSGSREEKTLAEGTMRPVMREAMAPNFLAYAMGQHGRLGVSCVFRGCNDDVQRVIFDLLCCPRKVGQLCTSGNAWGQKIVTLEA